MNFDFSDEQNQLREQARRLFANCDKRVRCVLNGGMGEEGIDRTLWQQVVDMGWPAAAIAECDGGLGLSDLSLCVLAEEMGRSLAPIPFVSSVLQATTALKQLPSDALTHELLMMLASGEKTASIALAEFGTGTWTARPRARVANGRMSGVKTMVADAPSAGFFIVSAVADDDSGNGAGNDADGYGWFVVDRNQKGVSLQAVECIDRVRPHADLYFDNVPCKRLGSPGQGMHYAEAALNDIAILTAFEQLGCADAALEKTIEYVKSRTAFNRPVASYQAVKHRLADMYVKNQLARSHCYYGAWALTEGRHALSRAAAGARLAATEALTFAAEEAVELHGGIGFTWEADIQLFYRRARLLASALGGRDSWSRRLAQALAQEHAPSLINQ